jgi:hypothetical protein
MSDGHTDGFPFKPPKFCLSCLGTGKIFWPATGDMEVSRTKTCYVCRGTGLYNAQFNLTDEEIEIYNPALSADTLAGQKISAIDFFAIAFLFKNESESE